jgi:hypothetical protein
MEHKAKHGCFPDGEGVKKLLEKYLKVPNINEANPITVEWAKNTIQRKIFKQTPPTLEYLLSFGR